MRGQALFRNLRGHTLTGSNPTPTDHALARRYADFGSLAEALDYAAAGDTGCNYYDGRGALFAVMTYAELRRDAMTTARRMNGLGLERGARVALIAETHPDFQRFFFACQYAGLVPVPVSPPLHLGGREAYVRNLSRMLADCQASMVIGPSAYVALLAEAAEGLHLRFVGSAEDFSHFPESAAPLKPLRDGELAHLQYTSGSTRFPRGVMISQRAVLSNLAGTYRHLRLRPGDRCVSWLPYYHDMGLVGLVLGPVASQLSVDYLGTREFAMRPRQWLIRMAESKATISFSPPFGYELVARRLRGEDVSVFDLSNWRVAGVGAETIRPETLFAFAETLAPAGFDDRAFLACYGLAESSLAVSFAPLFEGLKTDRVDGNHLSETQEALPAGEHAAAGGRTNHFALCGKPIAGHEVVVRDAAGAEAPERRCGEIFVRGPSVMNGYFRNDDITREYLSADGWLNTGDLGYKLGEEIVITGRRKDLIIINGRNIWPQDLEYIAQQQPEVRPGEASAFSVPGSSGEELAVLVIHCREADEAKRSDLVRRLQRAIHEELGIDCIIDLVPPRTLVRTSSGKLSRSSTRQGFLERTQWGRVDQRRAAG